MKEHNNFEKNLKNAQKAETKVALILRKNGFKVKSFNDDGKFDIVCETTNGTRLTFEVKEDDRCEDTGNIVIEYESRGRPSGIRTTQADVWVLRAHYEGKAHNLMYRTENLKQLIRDQKYWDKQQMRHTDSRNRLYFFKFDVLKEHADGVYYDEF